MGIEEEPTLRELDEWLEKELYYKDEQRRDFNRGYFHALQKVRHRIKELSNDD